MYFARINEINDPFEFYWREHFPTQPEEIDRFVREFCAKFFPTDTLNERRINYKSIKAWIQNVAERHQGGTIPTATIFEHGVLCLSEINDDILMWSHYAKCHSGVCVGIRPDRMEVHRILPIEYCENVPIIDAWDYIQANREAFVTAGRSKSQHWDYEKEWRTIHHPGPWRYPGCVDQVVIGARAAPETRSAVLEAIAAAEQHIDVFEARRNNSRYKLDIVPVIDQPAAKRGSRK